MRASSWFMKNQTFLPAEPEIFEILSSPEPIEGPYLNLGCRQIVEFWLMFLILMLTFEHVRKSWKFWTNTRYIFKNILFKIALL